MGKYAVAYASDDNYAMQTGVSIYSLLYNNQEAFFDIYIFSDGITEINKEKIMSIVKNFNCELKIIESPDLEQLIGENLFTGHWSKAAYSRIFFVRFLPNELSRVLYLDCDTLIDGKVDALFEEDLTNYACAAVLDSGTFFKKENGFKRKDSYFNSGVLLINLMYWRQYNIFDLFINEFKRRKGKSIDVDQSYINCVLINRIKKLPPKYNVMEKDYVVLDGYNIYLKKYGFKNGETYCEEEFKEALSKGVIIHFAGSEVCRPWFKECSHPKKDLWLAYLKEIGWSDYELKEVKKTNTKKRNYIRSGINRIVNTFLFLKMIYIRKRYGFWIKYYK